MYADCLSNIAPGQGLFLSLLAGGLTGSLTHCTGMCGPLVLGQIGALPDGAPPAARLLLPYHLGRITTYMGLAALFAGAVNVMAAVSLPKAVISLFLLAAAALMFAVTAVPRLAFLFPWLAAASLPAPEKLIGRLSRPLMLNPQGWRGYVLGILLGFMPCGLVVAALMAASTAPGPAAAAVAMGGFGLGTVPVLVTIACAGQAALRKWPVHLRVFSGIIMAANSLVLIWLAARQVI